MRSQSGQSASPRSGHSPISSRISGRSSCSDTIALAPREFSRDSTPDLVNDSTSRRPEVPPPVSDERAAEVLENDRADRRWNWAESLRILGLVVLSLGVGLLLMAWSVHTTDLRY